MDSYTKWILLLTHHWSGIAKLPSSIFVNKSFGARPFTAQPIDTHVPKTSFTVPFKVRARERPLMFCAILITCSSVSEPLCLTEGNNMKKKIKNNNYEWRYHSSISFCHEEVQPELGLSLKQQKEQLLLPQLCSWLSVSLSLSFLSMRSWLSQYLHQSSWGSV